MRQSDFLNLQTAKRNKKKKIVMKKHLILLVFMTIGLCVTAQIARRDVGLEQRNNQQQVKKHAPTVQKYAEIFKKQIAPHTQIRSSDWWEPDTIVLDQGYGKEREIFSYTLQGFVSSHLRQTQNGQSWENFYRFTYTYDENDFLYSRLEQMWESNSWRSLAQAIYIYDEHNNLTLELRQDWDDYNWTNNSRCVYTYDENNNLLTDVWESHYGDYGWEYDIQTIYTYDESNNLLTELFQWWWDNVWRNEYLDTYTYSGDKIVNGLGQYWMDDEWINEFQATITYNGENMEQAVLQYWENEQWENSERVSFSYENDNLLNELYEMWIGTNEWASYLEVIHTYDDSNNRTESIVQYWWDYGGWTPYHKTIWQYDVNNNAVVIENWVWNEYADKWESDVNTCDIFYNNMQSEMEVVAQVATITYIKTNSTNSIDEFSDITTIIIYPNPASGRVTISATAEIEQLQIFDITGRLVSSQSPANKQVVFDTGVLANGIYLAQARLKDGRVQTGKVVIN